MSSGTCAGVVMLGGEQVLNNIPQKSLDRAFGQFTRLLRKGSVVHRGIYSSDKPNLIVYTAIGGLGRPDNKLNELHSLGDLD